MNQSMVQQLTREGNMRRRRRKASPMGDLYTAIASPWECEHNNPNSLDARRFPSVDNPNPNP